MKIVRKRKYNVSASRNTRTRQFGIKAARVGKTKQVSVLQGNYGYGWEDLCQYDSTNSRECKDDLKAYRENEPGVPFRVIYRRVPNPDYKETPVEQTTSVRRRYTVKASKRLDVAQWENNWQPDEYQMDPEGLGYEQNRAIDLVGEIIADWQDRTPTVLDKSVVEQVYDLAYSSPKSCQELADEAYEILEEAYPELVDASTNVRKYTVKSSSAKRKNRVMAGYTMPYTRWVFDGDDGQWKMWGGANNPTIDDNFLYGINHPNHPNPEFNAEKNYTDVIVLPAGEIPNDGRPVKASSYTSGQCVMANSDEDDYERYRRLEFADRIVNEIEEEYSIKISDNAWGTIKDLAEDLSYTDEAEKHGSNAMSMLEQAIYDIIENDAGIVIGSSKISSSTAIQAAGEADVDEVKQIIRDSGIKEYGVTLTRTHLGDEYKIVLDDIDKDSSKVVDVLRNAGFAVELDTTDGNTLFLFIKDERAENAYLYRVSFDYTSEIVRMSDSTNNTQEVLDACIDQMEADGKTGYLYTIDQVEQEGWGEDMYIIGGNHDLALYTGGNLNVEPLGWSDEVGNVSAASYVRSDVSSNLKSNQKYDCDSKRDAKYLKALGDGVVKVLSNNLDGGPFTYEISDSAITFMDSADGSVLWIQPLDHIQPNMEDIDVDIEELEGVIVTENTPRF